MELDDRFELLKVVDCGDTEEDFIYMLLVPGSACSLKAAKRGHDKAL